MPPTHREKDANTFVHLAGIKTGLARVDSLEAVRQAGLHLMRRGYVGEDYIAAMLAREHIVSSAIGGGVAIPHGVDEAKPNIKASGLVVHQYPQGVDFGGQMAYLVVGFAGVGDDHARILGNIAGVLEDEATLQHLFFTGNAGEIYRVFASS